MTRRVAVLAGAWLLGVAMGAGALWLVVESEHVEDPAATAALALTAGLSFVTTGVVAIWRRPENRTGLLLAATGYAWLLGALTAANEPWVFTFGFLLGSVAWGPFAHLVLAYPTGRIQTRVHRIFVGLVYVLVIGEALALLLVDGAGEVCGPECPESTVAIWHSSTAADSIATVAMVAAVAIIVFALVIMVRRWRSATPALRRALGGVLLTSGTTLALLVLVALVDTLSDDWARALEYGALAAFATVPLAFLAGILRSRLARSAAGELLMRLGQGLGLRDALALALHDPTLEIGYWVPAHERFVSSEGATLQPADDAGGTRATELVERDGRPIAILRYDAVLTEEPELVSGVAAAAGLWLENERLQVETRTQYRFLETIVNTAPSLLVNVDTEGRIRNFNGAVERASGRDDPEEIRGRFFWDVFIDPTEREAMIGRFRDAAPEFPAAEYENVFTNARGERVVIAWSTAPLLDEEGFTRGVIAGGLDITERKRQELELQASEARLRAMIEAAPLAIVEIGLDDVVIAWNPAAERIFGWSAKEAIGRPMPFVPAEYEAEVADLVERVNSGQTYTGLEAVRLRKDGSLVEVAISAAPVRDATGAVVARMALFADITDRKRHERERRENEERLRAAIEASPVAIVEMTPDDLVLSWNPAAERMFGWTADEVMGKPTPIVPAEREREGQTLNEVVAGGEVVSGFETRRLRKDGTLLDVEISAAPLRDAAGTIRSGMALYMDVTERKQREAQIQGERDFLDTMRDTIPSLLAIVDREGRFLPDGMNRAFEEALGWTQEETARHSFLEFVHPEDDYPVRMAIAAAANGMARNDLEARWLKRDGGSILVAYSATPISHPSDPNLVLVTGVDITDRRAQEEEIRASRARIVEAQDQARRRLERDLHDGAQQRLVALSISLRLAEARLRTDPEGSHRLLASAREELSVAIDELRELARGIHPAVLTDRGLEAALEALAARAPLPVELSLPGERLPPPVEAGAYYLVAEALTNVAKYARASAAQVSVRRLDGMVTVEISDDGVGGADPALGTGLRGLADRVAALDGTLEVESEAGAGTCVRARIPVREPALSK